MFCQLVEAAMDMLSKGLSKASAATKTAYDAAATQAQKQKLTYDISSIDARIRKRKRQFGEDVYEPLCNGFDQEVKRLFEITKKDIMDMHNEKTLKKVEQEKLGKKGEENR
eukprot:3770303-Pyramimonas_sp.AAC.1